MVSCLGGDNFSGSSRMRSHTELNELFLIAQHWSLLQVVHFRKYGYYSEGNRQCDCCLLGVLGTASLLSSILPSIGALPWLKDCCSIKAMVRRPVRFVFTSKCEQNLRCKGTSGIGISTTRARWCSRSKGCMSV